VGECAGEDLGRDAALALAREPRHA
jgi:hypothetical protein